MSEPVMKASCYPEIVSLYEELKEHRRDIHAHPELGFDTDRTAEKIVAFLKRHEFTEKYGLQENEYDRCYDIYGKLRNKDYLEKIKREYKARKEYEERSRSYQRDYQSNYNNYSGSYRASSFNSGLSSEKEKEYYKKFYRTLATKFHPDVIGDNEPMKFINKLKGVQMHLFFCD